MENNEIKATAQDTTAEEAAEKAAMSETPTPEKGSAEPSSAKKIFLRMISMLPSVLLVILGLKLKWEMRGMKLLFMDSEAGKNLRRWWIPILIGGLLALLLVLRWIFVDHFKKNKSEETRLSESESSSETADPEQASTAGKENGENELISDKADEKSAFEQVKEAESFESTDNADSKEAFEEKASE